MTLTLHPIAASAEIRDIARDLRRHFDSGALAQCAPTVRLAMIEHARALEVLAEDVATLEDAAVRVEPSAEVIDLAAMRRRPATWWPEHTPLDTPRDCGKDAP